MFILFFTNLASPAAIMDEDNLPIILRAPCEFTIDGFRINGQRREEGSLLRKLFLPQTTRAAEELLLRRNFVFNQFQHYGIEYDTSKFAWSDMVQFKRALEARKVHQLTNPHVSNPTRAV